MDQSKEKSAILVDQNNPQELNYSFTQIIPFVSRPLVKCVKTVYSGGLNLLAYSLFQAGNESTKSYGRSRRA